MKILGIILGGILVLIIVWLIFIQVREKYNIRHDPMLDTLKQLLADVHPNVKAIPTSAADKSYTINKEKIYLCLKDPSGEYYPINMVTHVYLHELAHSISKSVGHNDEFYQVFDSLLKRAEELGVYNPKIPPIDNYCP